MKHRLIMLCSSLPHTEDLVVFPSVGSMFGGTQVFIGGPCFDMDQSIVCDFDGTRSDGVYFSSLIAMCVSPRVFTVGRVPLSVSYDGGNSFNLHAKLTIRKFGIILFAQFLHHIQELFHNSEMLILIHA